MTTDRHTYDPYNEQPMPGLYNETDIELAKVRRNVSWKRVLVHLIWASVIVLLILVENEVIA